MKSKFISLIFIISGLIVSNAQTKINSSEKKMEWFQDAKLGIFIHWGIYSVNGISESWAFFNNYINHNNYMKQLNGFSATHYNAEEWVKLIQNSGAKYTVITTRHHDGVSLWDTKADNAISIKNNSLAKKDVLTPFITALKKTNLKTGLYYSLPDWSHPNYDINTRTKTRYKIAEDSKRWQKYINYYQTQLNELSTLYQPDLIWFDGDWEHTSEEWRAQETLANLRRYNSNIIINSRLNHYGDYETPEQGIPVLAPNSTYWELCYTMNDSWGYQPFDTNYKTPNMIVRTLVDVISMGGNLLIDRGPKEDGTIPKEQQEILENLGRWTTKHSVAVYGTRKGLSSENYKGKSALSKDGKKLFLYLDEVKDFVKIYGLSSKIKSAKVVGDSSGNVEYNHDKNGTTTLTFHNVNFDQDVTVVELNFEHKIQFNTKPSDEYLSLSNLLDIKNTKQAAYSIAYQLDKGNNVLNNSGLTLDGEDMKIKTTSKTNPETLEWISKTAEALYNTEQGLPEGHYAGMSTLSKDKQTVYLFVEGTPTGPIALKGIKNKISRIRIVGEGSMIGHHIYNKLYWSPIPGIVYIDIPKERLDKKMTVIAILLDGPLDLYREKVTAVESNL